MDLVCLPEKVVNPVQLKRYKDRQHFPNLGRRVDAADVGRIVGELYTKEHLSENDFHTA